MARKNKFRHIIPTILISIIGGCGWWLSEVLSVKDILTEGQAETRPLFSMKNITASFVNEDGKRKYTLKARIMHRFTGEEGTVLENLHLIQHKQGGADIHTTADSGVLSEDQKHLRMKGNVKISSNRGSEAGSSTINTDTLEVILD